MWFEFSWELWSTASIARCGFNNTNMPPYTEEAQFKHGRLQRIQISTIQVESMRVTIANACRCMQTVVIGKQ